MGLFVHVHLVLMPKPIKVIGVNYLSIVAYRTECPHPSSLASQLSIIHYLINIHLPSSHQVVFLFGNNNINKYHLLCLNIETKIDVKQKNYDSDKFLRALKRFKIINKDIRIETFF